jgi:hypothetical protein
MTELARAVATKAAAYVIKWVVVVGLVGFGVGVLIGWWLR